MTSRAKSLLLLIDGYNVVSPVAAPARGRTADWLRRERSMLVNRLTEHLDEATRVRTCLVFDAANPPPDRPQRFDAGGIDVWFAIGYPEADDLIEELIAAHTAPKRLAVVSSDHRIQTAATRRGSTVFESQPWLDALLSGKLLLAEKPRRGRAGQRRPRDGSAEKPPAVSDEDTQQWMQDFGFDSE
jgi:predicted RNA-binding protein with PIN domain